MTVFSFHTIYFISNAVPIGSSPYLFMRNFYQQYKEYIKSEYKRYSKIFTKFIIRSYVDVN